MGVDDAKADEIVAATRFPAEVADQAGAGVVVGMRGVSILRQPRVLDFGAIGNQREQTAASKPGAQAW